MKFWEWVYSCFKKKKVEEADITVSIDSSIDSQAAARNLQSIIDKGLIPEHGTGDLFRDSWLSGVDVESDFNYRLSQDLFNHKYSE
jgi:hypothetical protein